MAVAGSSNKETQSYYRVTDRQLQFIVETPLT